MNITRVALISLLTVSLAGAVLADPPFDVPEVEHVLIPVAIEQTQGAYGTIWQSQLIVSNASDEQIAFAWGQPFCNLPGCGVLYIEPHEVRLQFGEGVPTNPGLLYVVEKGHSSAIQFSVRVWDTSRETSDYGTFMPVVRERDFETGPIELLNVPTDDNYRVTLRVYEPAPTNQHAVRVQVLGLQDGTELGEAIVNLRDGTDPSEPYAFRPSFGQIADVVGTFPAIRNTGPVRVRIEPLGDFQYWAFITVTSNDTQHVSVIAPQ